MYEYAFATPKNKTFAGKVEAITGVCENSNYLPTH
jgi:hypothetical protein